MAYWIMRFGAWILRHLHEAIGYPFFGLIGKLYYALNGKRRRVVAANMRIVLGPAASEREVQCAAREAFHHQVWNYYDLFHMPAFSPEAIRRRMDIQGVEHIDSALARGKGVLLISMHYGNVETLMQIPTLYPYMRFILLVEKMADRRIFELLGNLRTSAGMDIAAVDEPLKIIKRLKQNCVAGIACDRDVTNSGVVVDFFDKPARLPDGPVRLAMRTGAALIPAYGWRERSGQFRVRVLPEVEMVCTDDPEADVRVNMRRMLAVFERIIRERPGQWMAFHPLWV